MVLRVDEEKGYIDLSKRLYLRIPCSHVSYHMLSTGEFHLKTLKHAKLSITRVKWSILLFGMFLRPPVLCRSNCTR